MWILSWFPWYSVIANGVLLNQEFLVIELCPSWNNHSESFTVATVMEYLWHKWPRICSVCRYHNPVLFLVVTYHWVCNKSNATGATSGAGNTYLFRAPELTTGFGGVRIGQSFCVVFCKTLFVLESFYSCHCMIYPSSINGFWLALLISSNFSYRGSIRHVLISIEYVECVELFYLVHIASTWYDNDCIYI